MFRRIALSVLLTVLLAAVPALADTVVFQPGPDDGQDTWVGTADPGANHGGESILYFGGIPGFGEARLYIRFDLTGLAPGSNVTDAVLELYMYGQNGFMDTFNYGLYRVTAPWDENTLTWNTQPTSEDTPAVVFSGASWQAAFPQWHAIDGLETLVQFWVDHPDQNHGAVIKALSGYYGTPYIWPSEYEADPSLRPRLTVSGGLVSGEAESWSAVKGLYR